MIPKKINFTCNLGEPIPANAEYISSVSNFIQATNQITNQPQLVPIVVLVYSMPETEYLRWQGELEKPKAEVERDDKIRDILSRR